MRELELISAYNAGSTFQSVPLDIGDLINYSIQVAFSSATLNGTLTLEGSLDKSTWVTLPSSSQAIVSGAAHVWSVQNAGYRYVRVVWTYTSGAGTITAKAFLKEFPIKGA